MDVIFTKRFERRIYVALGVLLFSLALGFSFGAYALWPSNAEAGYSPVQPFPFNHQLHAGTLEINCLYCHSEATRGPHATVPAVSTCMNCHNKVQPKQKDGSLRPAIAELLNIWKERRPIEWIKVSDLADFVYFEHSRHVNSGIACQQCHGPVETMVQVRRQEGLKMAFCLDCHMQPAPSTGASDKAASIESPNVTSQPNAGTRGPTHCSTCHR